MYDIRELEIEDVLHISPKPNHDDRGFLVEITKDSFLKHCGLPSFVQDNLTFSKKNVLRGLHLQKEPYSQGKLLLLLEGTIIDVAVDVRRASPSFGNFVSVELDSDNLDMIYVPPGFAHGFYTISETSKILYKNTREYMPDLNTGIIWNDSSLKIDWPCRNPILSDKDYNLGTIDDLIAKGDI